MSIAQVLHLVFVSAWGGIVITETVIEATGQRDDAARATAARLHFWIDVLGELPILGGVVITGVLLIPTPLSGLVLVKIGAGAIAVAVNLYCAVIVIVRYVRRTSPESVRRLGWHVRASAIGVPFALVAAYLGLTRFLPILP